MTPEQQDEFLNDATHAVADELAAYGIELLNSQLYRLNDVLTAFLDEVLA